VPLAPEGPAAYLAPWPLDHLLDVLRQSGLPAAKSLSAGSYLCNAVFYHALHFLATRSRDIPAGFLHLPLLPEQAARKQPPPASMNLNDMVRGLLTVAQALSPALEGT